jgi:outer membrane protein
LKKSIVSMPALLLGLCMLLPAQPRPAAPAGAPAAPPVKAPAAAPGVAPTKIAIINIQQAIVYTKEGQKAIADLQARFNPRKSVLEKRQSDIGLLQDQLKKGGATMSDAAKEKIMRDIDSDTKSLNRDADDFNADMQQEQGKVMQVLGQKVMSLLDQYAVQNGYAVVIDVSNQQQNPVFWAAASNVITADIVKLYDQAHPVAAAARPAAPAPRPAAPAVKK